MILILSNNKPRLSLERVIDWIDYLGGQFIRVRGEQLMLENDLQIELNDRSFKSDLDIDLESKDINVVWCRGFVDVGEISQDILNNIEQPGHLMNLVEMSNVITRELLLASFSFFRCLHKVQQFPKLLRTQVNKQHVLLLAQEIGMLIPKTVILNSRKALMNFVDANGSVIVKPLFEVVHFKEPKRIFFYKTELVSEEDAEKSPDLFFPSLFQGFIEKEFEIRIFYFNGQCYGMSIFSDSDEKTRVDFRNYNWQRPNRILQYVPSSELVSQIEALMDNLDLSSGSLDFIQSKDGGLYFLEVNPNGQFGFVSYQCNFNLEKVIAETLISYDK